MAAVGIPREIYLMPDMYLMHCRSVSLLRLLVQARAASQHTSVLSQSQDDGDIAAGRNSGSDNSRSEVSSLLDGLRQRLGALEGANAGTSNTFQQQHTPADGGDATVDAATELEASLDSPALHQMLWAQRAPQLLPGIATGPEEMEPNEDKDDEEFDVSQLGKSPEVDRLLSILSTPVRLPSSPAEDTTGPFEPDSRVQPSSYSSATSISNQTSASTHPLDSTLTAADSAGAGAAGWDHQQELSNAYLDREQISGGALTSQNTDADTQFHAAPSAGPQHGRADEQELMGRSEAAVEYSRAAQQPFSALQDADIPDAAADFEWKQGHSPAQHASRDDVEPLDSDEDTFLVDGYGMAGGPRSEAVPVSDQRLLQAGIVGVPNSGKSTLTNALVGHKVRCLPLLLQPSGKTGIMCNGHQTALDGLVITGLFLSEGSAGSCHAWVNMAWCMARCQQCQARQTPRMRRGWGRSRRGPHRSRCMTRPVW